MANRTDTIFKNEIFYHHHLRSLNVIFGTIFNNIRIIRKTLPDAKKQVEQIIKVPLTYSKREKLIAVIQQDPYKNLSSQSAPLPRLCFSRNGTFEFDPDRQIGTFQEISEGEYVSTQPAPYNIGYELSIVTNNQEDNAMILEQILPFFQPDFIVKVNMVPESLSLQRDVVIRLDGISEEEEGVLDDLQTATLYTTVLSFTIQTWFFPPSHPANVIKFVKTDLFNDFDDSFLGGTRVHVEPIEAERDDEWTVKKYVVDDAGD